jgi:WD40 repeat protein
MQVAPAQSESEIVKFKFPLWFIIIVALALLIVALVYSKVQLFPVFAKPHTVISTDNAHELHIIASLQTRRGLDVVPEFSQDNHILLLPDIDGVHLWDMETGKERYYLQEPDACANGICIPNGYYDVKNFGGNTFRYALSPDGTLAAVAMNRGKLHDLRVWNTETGQLVKSLGRDKGLRDTIFSPDSGTLIYDSAPGDNLCSGLCAWDMHTDAIFLIDDLKPFDDWLTLQLKFMSDEATLVYSAYQVKTYNLIKHDHHILTENEGAVFAFANNADYSRVAIIAGGYEQPDYSVSMWDTNAGKKLFEVHANLDAEGFWDVQFDPSSLWFATAGEIHVWDAATGNQRSILKQSGVKYRQNFAVSPNGQVIAAWGYTGEGRNVRSGMGFWDAATGQNLVLVEGGDYLTKMAFSPDGTMLVTANGVIYGIG